MLVLLPIHLINIKKTSFLLCNFIVWFHKFQRNLITSQYRVHANTALNEISFIHKTFFALCDERSCQDLENLLIAGYCYLLFRFLSFQLFVHNLIFTSGRYKDDFHKKFLVIWKIMPITYQFLKNFYLNFLDKL